MRPVQYNNKLKMVEAPESFIGDGCMATSLEKVVGLARKNSIWPLPFATSCCGIEFMATMASHYDLARFGSERVGFSPRQCDLLMVMGTISKKMGPVLKQVYCKEVQDPRERTGNGSSPLVSVVVPNYNHAQFLPERIASITNQTYSNIEIILLDDNSTDESIKFIEAFVARDDRGRVSDAAAGATRDRGAGSVPLPVGSDH